MPLSESVTESVEINAPADSVYNAISDVAQMARWSPEVERIAAPREGALLVGDKFAGYNRRGARSWRTTSTVKVAKANEVFAFDVTAAALPIARWTYRIVDHGDHCELAETWTDLRTGPLGAAMRAIGFAATGVWDRASHNRAGIAETLGAVKSDLESHHGVASSR